MNVDVNPKTSEWMLKQPWLSQFVNNCIAGGSSPKRILLFLLGQHIDYTISEAFCWGNTPEGDDFWSKIDDEIIEVSAKENWDDFYTSIEV